MATAEGALRAGVHSALSADGTLSGNVYQYQAPEKSSFPYVVISTVTEVPFNHFAKIGKDCTVLVDVYSEQLETAQVYTWAGLVDDQLDYGSLTVSGYTHISTTLIGSDTLTEENYARVLRRYRVLLEEV